MTSTDTNPHAAKGKRYSDKEKSEILAFVAKVNAENGRGGQTAASQKYNISQLTISSWLNGSTRVRAGKGGTRANGTLGAKLAKLSALHDQITRLEKDLARMKAQFNGLKAAL